MERADAGLFLKWGAIASPETVSTSTRGPVT